MLDERFLRGVRHFDDQEYFEAHEVWEDLWNEANGPDHAFLQGLIQVAVALHHGRNGNWNGARKLCARSLEYLEKGKSAAGNVDIVALRNAVLDFENSIQSILKGEGQELFLFKLPLKE